MAAIALIGPDGAGKTTIARRLEASGAAPFRYLYMGVSAASSNVALPSTRLADALRRGKDGNAGRPAGVRRVRLTFPRLWALARTANLLADEWYRQLVSWYHQARGRVVLYDRHFLFDFTGADVRARNATPAKRFHVWALRRLFPRPDLVVFLDAPGTVLYERKGELSPGDLELRRQAYLQHAGRLAPFMRVDATRPLEEVFAEVEARVLGFLGARSARKHRTGEEAACSGS